MENTESIAITAKEVTRLAGISLRTWYDILATDSTVPPSIRLGPGKRARRWIKSEIVRWLTERVTRDVPPARTRRSA